MSPVHICLVYGDYPPKPAGNVDGGADFVGILADQLRARGFAVTALVSRRDDRTMPFVTSSGVRVLPLVSDWTLRAAATGELSAVRRALREAGVDVVHLVYPDPYLRYGSDSFHLPFALKLAGARRLVVTFFGFGLTGASVVTKAGLLSLFASADRIVITDHALLRRFRRTFAFWSGKTRGGLVGSIAHEATERWTLEALPARRRALHLSEQERLVGFFGFWSPDKGLEDLLSAVRLLNSEGPAVKLMLVGGRESTLRTDYENTIAVLIRELALQASVIDTGPLPAEEVARYLLAADVCVLPFRVNPLGRSSLAIALGLSLPTIVTRPPAGEHLLRGLTLVEAREPEGIAAAIRAVLASTAAQSRASACAAEAAVHWSWKTITDAYVADYEALRGAG